MIWLCRPATHSLRNAFRSRQNAPLLRRALSTAIGQKPEIYDIVCIGGGPVGLSLVSALKSSASTSRLRIALVEGQDLKKLEAWEPHTNEYSNRASSLTPSSVSFLKDTAAWDYVEEGRIQPYDEMQVWDGANGSRIQFDWLAEARSYNSAPQNVATMVENANLTRGLLNQLKTFEGDGLDIFSQTLVSSIENGEDDPENFNLSTWPVLSLTSSGGMGSPPPIAARLLVGADGANSPARAFAGIASNGWDYGRHGVVATLTLSPEMDIFLGNVTAYQRFLPALGGPIAILPLPDNRASLVWSTTSQNAAYLKALPLETLVTMINAAFRLSMPDLKYMLTLPTSSPSAHADEMTWRLPHTVVPNHTPPLVTEVQPSSVASFPLKFRQADTYVSPRVALVGDAAHTVHPLAGQGLNLGLGDAKALASTVAWCLERGADIGDILSLERYNRQRWGVDAKVAGACDLLHKVYNTESRAVAWARGLGLEAIDAIPWAKSFLMKQAQSG